MRRRYLWVGIGLAASVAMIIGISFFRQAYLQVRQAFFALQLLTEVQTDLLAHHNAQAIRLFANAESLLRLPLHPLTFAQLQTTLTVAYERLSPLTLSLNPGMIVVWIGLTGLVIFVFWIEERRIDRLQEDKRHLYSQWMAITTAWTGHRFLTHPEELFARILEQVKKEMGLDGVEIWQWRSDPQNALTVFVATGSSILSDALPIPQAFLEPSLGLLGTVIQDQNPAYSGEASELKAIFPGLRVPNMAILPLYLQENIWGFFVLWGPEHAWYFRHQDVLKIIALQISTILTNNVLEEQARRAEVYQQMARGRSELLANVSHELRTPLGLIRGYAETLLNLFERLQPEERQEFLSTILEESQQLEQLIDNLLNMSQIEEQGIALNRRSFALKPWIVGLLRRIMPQDRQRIHISVQDTIVFGDPERLFEALINIVENSLKYSSGNIFIMSGISNGWWTVRVRDEGPGVAASDLERIFQRFYRGSGAAQSDKRGSGLGLSIVKRIVEAHHGRIWAENVRPQGFLVGIELPLQDGGKGGPDRGYPS
ncbi:MAG: hypothetical protein C7B47_07370 [Sulfobacillus thermosulfidooxidans]|uniref:histidine kinase n=1 Tax=Sulfobacillus thermosulfidooxidans TaxID=28034 RepID=A0A2T2WZJ0_SULTH|nr:MAG: hypothetical protein C7B47_07370 [Sulfobacillus thermosulfidooxidans]